MTYGNINAIILAAGFGMRLVPINHKLPKALLCVNGKPLIEQQIEYLLEAGISEIHIVVGFMSERFYYLIDKYNVHIIENNQFAEKNNLYSLSLAACHLKSTYIIPGDVWCKYNPYLCNKGNSWYMVSNKVDNDSCVRIDENNKLIKISPKIGGNSMLGICYLNERDACFVRNRIVSMIRDNSYDNEFWEVALDNGKQFLVNGMSVSCSDFVEINTYEQFRNLDANSEQLKSEAIEIISKALCINTEDITDIKVLKKGMTNRSFLFSCDNEKYIMRIPGEGTDQLINRSQEADVYDKIGSKEICDDIIYINRDNGYKISKFINDSRTCDPSNYKDVKKCMQKVRELHNLNLCVGHEFDVFNQIEFYESLWDGGKSCFKDYEKTKAHIFSLRSYIEKYTEKKVLTHIDAVPDNFLIYKSDSNEEKIRLIDWEYAGMQDPHVDIAMFCIYSLYNKRRIDKTIDAYFENQCPEYIRLKIYCYVAVCGLLWSNWCEYKRLLGVEFGKYAKCQYKYAKDYYRLVEKIMSEAESNSFK